VWEGKSGDPYTDQMNGMAKYVVSSTLDQPTWNNTTVISGDVVAEIKLIKEQPGKDIVQYGFGSLAHTLMEHGLLALFGARTASAFLDLSPTLATVCRNSSGFAQFASVELNEKVFDTQT